MIAGDDEVQPAVAVDIDEAGARRPAVACHAGLFGDIGKRSVAVIPVQNIVAEVGDVEVRPAIVVVVAGRHPHSVGMAAHPGLLGDVGEGAVAVVVIQPVPILRIGLVGRLACRLRISESPRR